MTDRKLQKSIYNENLVKNSLRGFDKFVNASTIDDANQFAKDNITNIKKIDYTGFDLKIANRFNEHLLFLTKRYPQIKCNYLGIDKDDYTKDIRIKELIKKLNEDKFIKKYFISAKRKGLRYYMAKSLCEESVDMIKMEHINDYVGKVVRRKDEGYDGIWIHNDYAKSYNYLLQTIEHNISCNWSPKVEPCTEYILTHEFGHLIYDYLTNNGKKDSCIDDLSKSLSLKYFFNIQEYVEENLCRHAVKSYAEFFSAAFAEYIHSSKPRPIAESIGQTLEYAIKSKK